MKLKLVGQPLLYSISTFASLGVFLVCPSRPYIFCVPVLTVAAFHSSSDMTRVSSLFMTSRLESKLTQTTLIGVMSGIITGPYFKAFFHQPTRYEIGTMVATLEIGAFS